MSANTIILPFKNVDSDIPKVDPIWIKMDQVDPPIDPSQATIDKIFMMANMARSGLSTLLIQPDSRITFSNGKINVALPFNLWPSSLDLPYSLSLNSGTLSNPFQISEQRVFTIVVPMSDYVELPYLLEVSSIVWDTPIYDETGRIVKIPTYEIGPTSIKFDKVVFGVMRVFAKKRGYRYTAFISFDKSRETRDEILGISFNQQTHVKISNIKLMVVCRYTNEKDEPQLEQLELKLPQMLIDYLGECPDGTPIVEDCTEKEVTEHVTIYYSTCTGQTMGTFREDVGGGSLCDE